MNIVPHNPNSHAFKLGVQAAQAGESCTPECIFVSRRQQIDFAAGFESVSGVTFATSQFTGSELPKPIVIPNRKTGNGREYTRKADSLPYQTQVRMMERRQNEVEAAFSQSAEFLNGAFEGCLLFA